MVGVEEIFFSSEFVFSYSRFSPDLSENIDYAENNSILVPVYTTVLISYVPLVKSLDFIFFCET